MNPPPNPNESAARSDMQAYNMQVKQAERQDLLERTFEKWPDMRRYADTARVESIIAWINGQRVLLMVVTVTVFDKQKEATK